MFIELAEFLRCPEGHPDEPYCVVAPDVMVERRVVRGSVGCPVCRREYGIAAGVVDFGAGFGGAPPATEPAGGGALPDAAVVQALLGLESTGGYVVLFGSAAHLAMGLAALRPGVHLVGVNAPPEVEPSPAFSLLRHPAVAPLRSAMARGVVMGRETTVPSWLAEGARVLLRGQRLVALREAVAVPGVATLADGQGLWVGQKTL